MLSRLPTRSTLKRLSLITPCRAPLARRMSARQRAASSAGSNGLLKKSSAPRSSALTLSASVQRAVRISVGVVSPAPRRRRTRLSPSVPGSPTSMMASANSSLSSAACAASALVARCTV
jgi:hypothetical protein